MVLTYLKVKYMSCLIHKLDAQIKSVFTAMVTFTIAMVTFTIDTRTHIIIKI